MATKDSALRLENAHSLSVDESLKGLKSTPEGLAPDEAGKRLDTHGPNRLPAAEKEGFPARFFKHFHDLLIYVLFAAAVITAALGHWIDTGVILAVVVINAVIGFIQEGRAEQALEGIRKMLPLHAHVRRGGGWIEIEADELVPGDLVRLRSGDRVPADIRLMETTNLRIGESALTGESVPIEKKTDPAPADAGICSDKTGTPTRNEMTVRHAVTRAGQYDVEGTGYAPSMQKWFGSASLELRHWLVPPGIAAGTFLLIEGEKAVIRRFFLSPDSNRSEKNNPASST